MKRIRLSPIAAAVTYALFFWAPHVNAEEPAPSFEIYGFGMADYIQDFRRVDPAWKDTLRPSKIPTVPGQYGSDGQATIDARQSRFGVQGTAPIEGEEVYARLEFDFFGVGVNEGQTTIRLRHAYGSWGPWLAGQTHSLFMDVDVFPNIIDYWGPPGMVFLRLPQIRWTPIQGDLSFALALEKPTNDIDPGQIRDLDPNLGDNLQGDSKVPDLTAQVRSKTNWGHVQLAGILRRVGYDTAGSTDGVPKGFSVGWGFDLTSNLKFGDLDKLNLSGVYGRGIASYMNDGGTDLAPEGTPGNLKSKALPLWGIVAYYDHYWTEKVSTSLGYSRTQVENTDFQSTDAFYHGDYASVNCLYNPNKKVLMGIEFLWGMRTDKNGASGNDVRSQISFKYSFSSKTGS